MKQEIPWNKLVVEAIVIVSSILLALAIDSLWGNYQDNLSEERYLRALLAELINRSDSDNRAANELSRHVENISVLSRAVDKQVQAENISMFSILPLLSYSPQRAALDDLVGSGGYQLINDSDLRLEITRQLKLLTDLQEFQETHQIFSNMHYLGPLMTHILPGAGTGRVIERFEVEFEGLNLGPDLESLYKNRNFYNTLYLEIVLSLQRIRVLENISESRTQLIEMIRSRYE
jgi:hypothetical protein